MSPKYRIEYEAFAKFIRGERIPLRHTVILIFKAFLQLIEMLIRYIPGPIGFKLRYYYYKMFLKNLGKNVLIDVGVFLSGPANISIGEYTWIDQHVSVNGMLGEISIGKRVHVGPFTQIWARAPVVIEDYVGISSFVKILANSEVSSGGKRMSGPMIPEEHKAYQTAPITIRKDAAIGTTSVILPGVELGEGAVVGPNSVIMKNIKPYDVVMGLGKTISVRDQVTMPDL